MAELQLQAKRTARERAREIDFSLLVSCEKCRKIELLIFTRSESYLRSSFRIRSHFLLLNILIVEVFPLVKISSLFYSKIPLLLGHAFCGIFAGLPAKQLCSPFRM